VAAFVRGNSIGVHKDQVLVAIRCVSRCKADLTDGGAMVSGTSTRCD
jgi:hypothetical protein